MNEDSQLGTISDGYETGIPFRAGDFAEMAACPICDSASSVAIGTSRSIHPQSNLEVTIVACLNCGHWYTDPMPSDRLLNALYSQSSLYVLGENWAAAVEARNTDESLALESYWVVKSLARMKPGNLLEIGCGDGSLLRRMRLLGWNAYGVDPGSYSAGFQTVSSASQLPKQILFDAIVLQDVLEHVSDPLTALSEFLEFLAPNAVLLMAVPWSESKLARINKVQWCMVRPLGHLHYYSRKSAELLLNKLKFVVIASNSVNIYGNYWKDFLHATLSFSYGLVSPSRWTSLRARSSRLAKLITQFPGDLAGDQLCVLARLSREP